MIAPLSSRPDFPCVRGQVGFTLAELAIVLFIVGLMLAGAIIPLTTQIEVRSIAETRRIMDQINDALIGFAQSNGRLPCPASATAQTGVSTAGMEQYNTLTKKCTADASGNIITLGVIPWSTLGVPETDSWGRRFTYRVALAFSDDYTTNATWTTTTYSILPGGTTILGPQPVSECPASPSPTPTLASFALCALGELAVLNRTSDALLSKPTPGVLGQGLAAVFLSHGRNGYGGYQSSGVAVSGLTAGTDEANNVAGGLVGTPTNGFPSYQFYSRTPTPYSSPCSETAVGQVFCEFDDIVSMIPATTLAARMVSAGRLP